MLILTRKNSQSLIIAGEVRVTVLKTQGNTVRLGIEAPPHVSVHRSEVYERILANTPLQRDDDTTQQDAA